MAGLGKGGGTVLNDSHVSVARGGERANPDGSSRAPRQAGPSVVADARRYPYPYAYARPQSGPHDDGSGLYPGPDGGGSGGVEQFRHLVEQLARMTPENRTAGELVDLVAEWEKVQAWVHARQTEVVAELAQRPECQQASQTGHDVGCTAADEIGLRLRVGTRTAQRLVRRARALHGPQLATLEALETGQLDRTRADIIVDGLEGVVPQVAFLVEDRVLPGAAKRTPTQLRRDVQRALIDVDPQDAEERFQRAKAGRYVSRPKPLPHGMAGIWAVLPAVDAMAVDSYLQAVAVTMTTATAKATATATTSTTTATPATAGATSSGPGRDTRTRDQVRADALLDAIFATSLPASTATSDVGEPPEGTRGRSIEVQVVVPLSVLTGSDNETGQLRGYGAISAAEARRLAGDRDATWRRLVTDPTTGVVLDHGRTRYRPPAALADLVRSRDQGCVMPNCSASANNCDIDHTVPFPQGPTSITNLGLLCRRHHRLKTHAGWRLEQTQSGHFRWTTPAGQRTSTGPEPPF